MHKGLERSPEGAGDARAFRATELRQVLIAKNICPAVGSTVEEWRDPESFPTARLTYQAHRLAGLNVETHAINCLTIRFGASKEPAPPAGKWTFKSLIEINALLLVVITIRSFSVNLAAK